MTAEQITLRKRLRISTARFLTHGVLYRGGTDVGLMDGYAYTKQSRNTNIGLPGLVADQPNGHYFMALYPDELPKVLPGDVLLMNGQHYKVVAVNDYSAYVTLRLEEDHGEAMTG